MKKPPAYDPAKIERKWQKKWASSKIYRSKETADKKKAYILDMFPYPSGEGLHVGHPKGYIATDVVSRMRRMQGMNVLHPMGFDAFGLPAENYAIKMKTNPMVGVAKNVKRFKEQLEILGLDYDWSREVNTTDPKYYRWTQWIFLQLLAKGLAYESDEPVNWCPTDKTVLANEDVENGRCERCGALVEKKKLRQWVLRITDYADRLLKDLDAQRLTSGDLLERMQNGEPCFIQTHEPGMVRPDKPIVERQAVAAFIEHWSEDKFLILKWKKVAWHTAITGGVEAGQTPEQAALSEIIEETGYKNLKLIKKLDGQLHSIFFHVPKDENRFGHFSAFHFKLENDERAAVEKEEQDKHEIVWVSRNEVLKTLTAESLKYAWGRMILGIDTLVEAKPMLDWPEAIKESQRNWIGRSEGALIKFKIKGSQKEIEVFTTRSDTLFGVTYVVLAPEAKLVNELLPSVSNKAEVDAYISNTQRETEIQRTDASKEKTGVELKGVKAINPANGEEVPVWIADYVLADYGTGSVMAVPAHDERDADFAKKYHLPVKEIELADKDEITRKFGKKAVKYKLRDWVFSRQRYWGEPIPVIHCPKCGVVPVPEKDLPVLLPKVKSYEPTGTGESPLAAIVKWVNVKCPQCGGRGKRETNTMPQWAGSSWYYLRYEDPKNSKMLVDQKKEKYWSPVDLYVGGAEHATRHLIYARFWHKFLYDIGAVSGIEPFARLQSVGLIMGEDGRKMSKRFGNVVNPDDIVKTYGADTLRVYEMFMGPFDQAIPWSTDSIVGSRRFIERVWKLAGKVAQDSPAQNHVIHKAIKKVTEDIESLRFNTAVSTLMIALNELDRNESVSRADFESFLKLFAPFAPHAAEELWASLGNKKSIHVSAWPAYDPSMIAETEAKIILQVNGKVRGSFMVPAGTGKDELTARAKALPEAQKWLEGKPASRVIVVVDRLVNIVAG